MGAGTYNFAFEQGVPFVRTLRVAGVSLTGLSAKMQLRRANGDALLAEVECAVQGQEIQILIPAEDSLAIPTPRGNVGATFTMVHDLVLYGAEETTTLPMILYRGTASMKVRITK